MSLNNRGLAINVKNQSHVFSLFNVLLCNYLLVGGLPVRSRPGHVLEQDTSPPIALFVIIIIIMFGSCVHVIFPVSPTSLLTCMCSYLVTLFCFRFSLLVLNGLYLYSAFIQSTVQFMPLIHPFTHQRQLAAMQGTNQLIRSDWGRGVLLKDMPRARSNWQPSDCQTTALTSWAISPQVLAPVAHSLIRSLSLLRVWLSPLITNCLCHCLLFHIGCSATVWVLNCFPRVIHTIPLLSHLHVISQFVARFFVPFWKANSPVFTFVKVCSFVVCLFLPSSLLVSA